MTAMKNLMTACLLAAFLCSASCGCSKDSGGGEDDGGKIAGVTVKPAYNKSQVLHNPLNGWVMYVSATTILRISTRRSTCLCWART